MSEELKPCPFCGKEPFICQLSSADPESDWHISCENWQDDDVQRPTDCPVRPSLWKSYCRRKDAIKAWNTRDNSAIQQEQERITQIIEAHANHKSAGSKCVRKMLEEIRERK